jgi:hypothetical protein
MLGRKAIGQAKEPNEAQALEPSAACVDGACCPGITGNAKGDIGGTDLLQRIDLPPDVVVDVEICVGKRKEAMLR